MTAHETGQRGEAAAEAMARSRGWEPWLGNVRMAGGEADLICKRVCDGRREGLVVEVKTSRGTQDPAERLGQAQKQRLWQIAAMLADQHELDRVEVVLVVVSLRPGAERVRWIELEAY